MQVYGRPISEGGGFWWDVSSTNLNRPSPRQGNDAVEAWIIGGAGQCAAVEPGNGGCEAQTKAGARLRAALFQPYKTLDYTRAICFRDTRSAIGYRKQNPITLFQGPHDNLGRHAVGSFLVRFCVLDRVVHEIGECLTDKLPITLDWRWRFGLHL